jgi:hypothetical protein
MRDRHTAAAVLFSRVATLVAVRQPNRITLAAHPEFFPMVRGQSTDSTRRRFAPACESGGLSRGHGLGHSGGNALALLPTCLVRTGLHCWRATRDVIPPVRCPSTAGEPGRSFIHRADS